jgi:heme/copper-type cytochrome/quinol oxidase subunit 3
MSAPARRNVDPGPYRDSGEARAARRRRQATPASVPAVRRGDALDVSELPSYGFGTRSLMWWGPAGMSTIEAMGFVMMILVYFDLKSRNQLWPNEGDAPGLLWGTVNLALAFVSAIPNVLADKAANDHDLRKIRLWLVVFLVIGLALIGVRWLEFNALNVRWDASAYGSAVWVLFGLHTFNLLTNYADTLVVAAVVFKEPMDGKRYVDVAENAGYWWFIVLSWIPIYAVVYWGARF